MTKASNHAKAPLCAKFVEEFRRVFGEDQVILLYVKEGDFEWSKDRAPQSKTNRRAS